MSDEAAPVTSQEELEQELERVEREVERREQRVSELVQEHEALQGELATLSPRRNVLSGVAMFVTAAEAQRAQLKKRLERKMAAVTQAREDLVRARERRDVLSQELHNRLLELESGEAAL